MCTPEKLQIPILYIVFGLTWQNPWSTKLSTSTLTITLPMWFTLAPINLLNICKYMYMYTSFMGALLSPVNLQTTPNKMQQKIKIAYYLYTYVLRNIKSRHQNNMHEFNHEKLMIWSWKLLTAISLRTIL
jgi:hypothetical protein